MNKGLGLVSSICPSAGHLQAFHTATRALLVKGKRPAVRLWDHHQDCSLHPDPYPSRRCCGKVAAGSHLHDSLQLDDIACMPQAHRLAPCQALIARLWFLEVGKKVATRGCKGQKGIKGFSPPPRCWAGVGSSEAGSRILQNRAKQQTGTSTLPFTSLKSVLSMKTVDPKGT